MSFWSDQTAGKKDITFFVSGVPRPGGSKKSFYSPKTKRVITKEDCEKNKDWRSAVAYFARRAYQEMPLMGPVRLQIIFWMPRPKYHYGTGRNSGKLKPSAPYYHTSAPDATKLMRSTEDALKAIIWKDDSQVADQRASKLYGEKPGAEIRIEPLG